MEENNCKLGIIIVNWNRPQDTLDAYASLKSSTHKNWWLYVIDNASENNSVEILARNLNEQATLIKNTINAGFSGGCNLGIERALSEHCTHIFLLNNDAIVLPSTIMNLINESYRLNNKAILGCAVKIHGTEIFQFFGSKTRDDFGHPTWFNQNDLEKISQNLIETDFVIGAALFASAEIWNKVGYFNEKFYLNYEETDWCYRARKIGFPCYIVPASVIIHKVGATIGPTNGPMQNYFIYRNELLFAQYHATPRQKSNIIIRTVMILTKSVIKDVIKFRIIRPATIAHAIALYDFFRGNFGDCPKIIRSISPDRSHL